MCLYIHTGNHKTNVIAEPVYDRQYNGHFVIMGNPFSWVSLSLSMKLCIGQEKCWHKFRYSYLHGPIWSPLTSVLTWLIFTGVSTPKSLIIRIHSCIAPCSCSCLYYMNNNPLTSKNINNIKKTLFLFYITTAYSTTLICIHYNSYILYFLCDHIWHLIKISSI